MNATITALRPGRTRALIQKRHRKAHVASIAPGETHWLAMCGRPVPTDGTTFWISDAASHGEEHADDMCRDCHAISTLIGWILDHATSITTAREAHG